MSRITQSIIKSAFDVKLENIIGFFNPAELDLNLLNIDSKIFTFEPHQLDINQKLCALKGDAINTNISILPDAILCCWLPHYNNAKNLAVTLKLPLINIIKKDSLNVKKESLLELSRGPFLEDINLLESVELATQLFISNYYILQTDIKSQLLELINQWIPN